MPVHKYFAGDSSAPKGSPSGRQTTGRGLGRLSGGLRKILRWCGLGGCALVMGGLGHMAEAQTSGAIRKEDFRTSEHPRILARAEDRAVVWEKIQNAPWAGEIYRRIRNNVDRLVERHVSDPEFIVSRLQMHWQEGARYTVFRTEGNFIPHREGDAPYPTVRVAWGRAAPGSVPMPSETERIPPYGNGELPKREGDQWVMVPFEKTGLGAENINQWILERAYDAAIVYYFTGDRRYAKFAADIFWTFVRGASYQQPVNPDLTDSVHGYLSWETLGDSRRFTVVPLIYDFIYDYLVNEYFQSEEFLRGRPGELWAPPQPGGKAWAMERIEIMFKTFIENKLNRGGGLLGNWNLNEHHSAILYALALEDDEHYADGRGRAYYVNRLVYGPTTKYHGAYVDVAQANINPETGLWPEPPSGYGQGCIEHLVRLGFVYWVNGIDVLQSQPILRKAVRSFVQMAFPNGRATCWGDGGYHPISKEQAELMIAYARAHGERELEEELTGLLIFAGGRDFQGAYHLPLFWYVPELKGVSTIVRYPRTSYSPDHSIIFGRNPAPASEDWLAYSVYGFGARSGHRHTNGMAMELYGRGHILGADPGAGPDYWHPQHGQYNRQVAAHNTVIPNGLAADDRFPQDLVIEQADPPVRAGREPDIEVSRLCQFTDTSNLYRRGEAKAHQRRLLAIIRSGVRTGYYLDVFRSRMEDGADRHHDYLYHNMGLSVRLWEASGQTLSTETEIWNERSGPGYQYFRNVRRADYEGDFRAEFDMGYRNIRMSVWGLGQAGRKLFCAEAPNNFRYYLAELRDKPVPTLIVRQDGSAWERPFVMVFEPWGDGVEPTIARVRWAAQPAENNGLTAVMVQHNAQAEPSGRTDYLFYSLNPQESHSVQNMVFQGTFGAALMGAEGPVHLYLGMGKELAAGDYRIRAAGADGDGVRAAVTKQDAAAPAGLKPLGYSYSASDSIYVEIPLKDEPKEGRAEEWVYYQTARGIQPAQEVTWRAYEGKGKLVRVLLPAAADAALYLGPRSVSP